MDNLPLVLSKHLSDSSPETKTEWTARPAAVLIPLLRDQGEWQLLFTRRTDHLDSHQGQVSFPGGAVDAADDSPVSTALRETHEEIGIFPDQVEVLGVLDSLLTVTQFEIIPIVGVIPWPTSLIINTVEVARVFTVPLTWLADEQNLEVQMREFRPGARSIEVYHFAPYDGEVIWGATARLTVDFLSELQSSGLRI